MLQTLFKKKKSRDWAQDAWNLILYPHYQLVEDILFLSKFLVTKKFNLHNNA